MVVIELDLGIDNGETKITISIIDKNGQLSQTYIVTSNVQDSEHCFNVCMYVFSGKTGFLPTYQNGKMAKHEDVDAEQTIQIAGQIAYADTTITTKELYQMR